jgi:hypothetical protein
MSGQRLFVAGLAAILAASFAGTVLLLIALHEGDLFVLVPMLLTAMVLAAMHFLFLGLPLAVFVATRWRIGWGNSGLAGLAIGGIPSSILLLGGADLDGMVLWSTLPLILCLAGAGLAGGLAFRAVWRDREESAPA